MVAFVRQYQYNSDMAPDRMQLQNMCKKGHKSFKEYAQRWRDRIGMTVKAWVSPSFSPFSFAPVFFIHQSRIIIFAFFHTHFDPFAGEDQIRKAWRCVTHHFPYSTLKSFVATEGNHLLTCFCSYRMFGNTSITLRRGSNLSLCHILDFDVNLVNCKHVLA